MATTAQRLRPTRSDRTPPGIHIGLGAGALIPTVGVAALLPASAGQWRLVPVAAVLAVIGVYAVDPLAVGVLAALAYLLVVGFLVNRYGILTWHGLSDLYRLMVISTAAGSGLSIGAVRHWLSQRRRFTLPREWLAGEPTSARVLQQGNKEGVPGV